MTAVQKFSTQMVGNAGLYHICYELTKRNWNAMPTARNARSVDIVIYSQDATRTHTIQVKTLSKRNAVPLSDPAKLMGNFFIVCTKVFGEPEVYIATVKDIIPRVVKNEKDGKISYWLEPKAYEEFEDNWDIIGNGS